jgi:hypothetical protein
MINIVDTPGIAVAKQNTAAAMLKYARVGQ